MNLQKKSKQTNKNVYKMSTLLYIHINETNKQQGRQRTRERVEDNPDISN
jgi:hypothetical protein